ncbi:MAG: NAD(P)-dependent oxidoreductase [Dehalococcoidia bacterium]|nr:NAD(P)-dependent oxidoreductase [Dehalococcoidia bacterium]
MKVLLTGAFGNIGQHTITQLLKKGHQVRCLDLDTKANRQKARKLKGKVETVWADVASRVDVEAAVKGQDAVIHMAWVIDLMWSEAHPEEARKVHVGGTVNIIEAMKAGLSQGRKLVFISSVSVFGGTQHLPPPRKASDPVNPDIVYARQKAECEELVKKSGLDWCILRLTLALPIKAERRDYKRLYSTFDFPLDARIEFVDPRDVALAIANSLTSPEAAQKILLIGGGSRNQMLWRDYWRIGLGYLGQFPEEAFAPPGTNPPIDWADTAESQRILNYQNHTLQDFVKEQQASLGAGRYLVPLIAPFLRRWMLQQSRYYKASRQRAARQAA